MVRISEKPAKKIWKKTDVPDVAAMVESIVGCKWSLHVLDQIRKGVNRPGAMVRSSRGLTTKVLNERLNKMLRFDILEKISYPEVPPRVEYTLTPFGRRFVGVLDAIAKLQEECRPRIEPGDKLLEIEPSAR